MFWMSAFLDLAPDRFVEGAAFWCAVSGHRLSAVRGADREFATLLPSDGDDHLRVQRLGDGPSRLHLDLHVEDPKAAARHAESLGANVRVLHEQGYVVMASPGGFPFCFVRHRASRPAAPATWPGGHRSAVDQVCLDIPAPVYDAECDFWQRLTGWELRVSPTHEEFRRLIRPPDQPLQLLLQRLGDADGPVRAHLDLATSDRDAETSRHVALGATVLDLRPGWTVLADPAGSTYCITDRAPETRVLDARPAD